MVTSSGQALTVQVKDWYKRADELQKLVNFALVRSVPYYKQYRNLVVKADRVTARLARNGGDDYNHMVTLAKSASVVEEDRQALISCLEDLLSDATYFI
jgi:hypothetical protein